jgi:hypothetical protein
MKEVTLVPDPAASILIRGWYGIEEESGELTLKTLR